MGHNISDVQLVVAAIGAGREVDLVERYVMITTGRRILEDHSCGTDNVHDIANPVVVCIAIQPRRKLADA